MAGEMLLTDIASGQWSDELCDLVGIAPGQLSPVLPSEAPLGTLLPEVARATGFAADTAVINGGQDHSCEALALGLDSRGDGMLACGTAWVINAITETSGMDSIPSGMSLNHHVLPNRWVASQFLGGFGACLEWWSQQCRPWQAAETRQERWSALNAALEKSGPGCAGLLYFPQTGLRRGRDAIDHGGFVRLRLDHSQADMGRAIMEAAAFELQWTLEQLVGAGLSLGGIWMVGGATRSPLWPQIVADVTGLPVSLSQYTHGPALGAAILAGLGLGIFGSVGDGLERFRVSAKKVSPNGAGAAAYDRQLASYRQLSRVLVP
jgi:xylulokinase